MSQTLARCIAQHRALLAEAEEALAWEKRMHAENAALLDDMSRMRDAPAPLPPSSHTESELLAALVRVTDRAFGDRRQCQQLRHLATCQGLDPLVEGLDPGGERDDVLELVGAHIVLVVLEAFSQRRRDDKESGPVEGLRHR